MSKARLELVANPDEVAVRTMETRVRALPRVIGCWHRHLSRPFTRESETYRACLDCGARRGFDISTWRSLVHSSIRWPKSQSRTNRTPL